MEIEDSIIISRIIDVLQMTPEDLSDGECLDEIINILQIKYTIDFARN